MPFIRFVRSYEASFRCVIHDGMKCAGQKQKRDWSIGREEIPETRPEIGVKSRAAVMENEEALG